MKSKCHESWNNSICREFEKPTKHQPIITMYIYNNNDDDETIKSIKWYPGAKKKPYTKFISI